MAKKVSETGHAVNLGRMTSTVSIIEGLGADYNPAHEDIKPDALRQYLQACAAAQDTVKDAEDAYDRAVNARRDLYAGIKKRATRIVNAYADAGASAADLEDVRGVNRKLQGNTLKAAKDPGQDEAGKRAYSTSQRGYSNQADHFDSLVRRVSAFRGYNPSADDLKPAALRALHTSLTQVNEAVDLAAHAFRSAREARSKLFYDDDRGMTARSKRLRNYFKTRTDGSNPMKGISIRKLD